MSTINSTSTLAQVQNAYDDNASYAEDNSVTKCRALLTACRILLRRMPARTGTREAQLQLNAGLIQQEMKAAQGWPEAHDTISTTSGPRVTRASFGGFR
jgi:hypothetical protein